jgi:putative nucleotidyltransferase with HDIG domain
MSRPAPRLKASLALPITPLTACAFCKRESSIVMKAATHTHVIDVQALRVGMFVHLDVGWMAHPFPLSSFRITSPAQVATIRSLGLDRVRWSPLQSDPVVVETGTTEAALAAPSPVAANDPDGPDTDVAKAATSAVVPEPIDDAGGPVVSAEEQSRAERRRRLERQRAALKTCERQYGEASRACRQTIELVAGRPREAKAQAEALTLALVEKMTGDQELCIRMLTENAADKASMHAMNVGIVSLLMGRCFGFSSEEMQDIGVGAMLHDIGKLDLPTRMRHPEDNFSPSETRVYQEHVELGLVQARRMGLSPGAMAVIAQHHEHADGSGFPGQLNSDRMTMAARIVALVDRYDNLCNPRLAAKAMTPHESLSLLFAQGRRKFDTSILGAFIKMMGVYPPGSMVQLTDDRYGMVVAVNSSRPLKPSVLVHDAGVPREEALVLDLELSPGLGIRRSIKPQQLPPTALEYLAPGARVSYFFEPAHPVEEGL